MSRFTCYCGWGSDDFTGECPKCGRFVQDTKAAKAPKPVVVKEIPVEDKPVKEEPPSIFGPNVETK